MTLFKTFPRSAFSPLLVLCLLVLGLMLTPPSRALDNPETTREPVAAATVVSDTVSDAGPIIVNVPPTSTSPDSANSPIVYGIITVLALLLVAAFVFSGYIISFIATMVPPETASSIYQSGVRFGLQMALNQAAQTPTTADDDFFKDLARQRGLEVTRNADGMYEVKYAAPIPIAAPAG